MKKITSKNIAKKYARIYAEYCQEGMCHERDMGNVYFGYGENGFEIDGKAFEMREFTNKVTDIFYQHRKTFNESNLRRHLIHFDQE